MNTGNTVILTLILFVHQLTVGMHRDPRPEPTFAEQYKLVSVGIDKWFNLGPTAEEAPDAFQTRVQAARDELADIKVQHDTSEQPGFEYESYLLLMLFRLDLVRRIREEISQPNA